jgi:aspartate carbamoyltransferase regulatory subunit
MNNHRELRVRPIVNGTVIDHILAGQAINVLRILGVTGVSDAVVSMVMNVPSITLGHKDIVKIENRELEEKEVDKISLISPSASINIIRDFEVVDKYHVEMPSIVEGMVKCTNPNCISNTNEPVTSKFVVRTDPIRLRCLYCEHVISEKIAEYLL